MGIFSFWTRRRTAKLIANQAAEVAHRSQAIVLDRVRRRATTMRIAEARGYVRSRALDIVHRELAAVHDGQIPLEPSSRRRSSARRPRPSCRRAGRAAQRAQGGQARTDGPHRRKSTLAKRPEVKFSGGLLKTRHRPPIVEARAAGDSLHQQADSSSLAGVLSVFQTPYHADESIDYATLEKEDRLAVRARRRRHRDGHGL